MRIASGGSPAITADGRIVALESPDDLNPANEDGLVGGSDDGGGLFLADAVAGTFTRVYVLQGRSTLASGGNPAISADGRILALGSNFGLAGEELGGGIYVITASNGPFTIITKDTGDGSTGMSMSADGRFLA